MSAAASTWDCYTRADDGELACTWFPAPTSQPESTGSDKDPNRPVGTTGLSTTSSTNGATITSMVTPTAAPSSSLSSLPSSTSPPSSTTSSVIATSTLLPDVSSGGSQGVSKGAVAGIAISTAILGAAIALLAAFFLLKRRRGKSDNPYSDFAPELVHHGNVKNTPYMKVSQVSAPAPVRAVPSPSEKRDINLANLSNSSDFLAGILAPAADEQSVKTRVAGMFKRFQDHVDSYYRDVHATMTPSMESDLARFGSGLVEILEHSSVPTVAIKHALAGYVLSIISPEAEDQATLFPAEIAGLKANERSTDADDQPVYMLYKRLAVHLHAPTVASLQSRQSDIREAAEHFALTFFPWANPAFQESEKDEELIHIISDALDVSIWLHGQPYTYDYVWESVGKRGTIVAPGLSKFTDRRGVPFERPRVLLEPSVVAS